MILRPAYWVGRCGDRIALHTAEALMLSRDAYNSLCFAAGAVLLRGPFTPLVAQDAYRPITATRGDVSVQSWSGSL